MSVTQRNLDSPSLSTIMLARISPRQLLARRPLSRNVVLPYVRFASRKTVRPFLLADIGEGITECEVLKWYVWASAFVTPLTGI